MSTRRLSHVRGPNLFISVRLCAHTHLFVIRQSSITYRLKLTMDGALGALQIAKQHLAKLLFGLSFIPSLGIASILLRSSYQYNLWRMLFLGITSCAPAAYLVRGFFKTTGSSQRRHEESLFWRELLPCLISKSF
jgi:hypothetical protein